MTQTGLFVGLTTLDLVYALEHPLQPNQKQVATDFVLAAGGPATNAAVTFQSFQNQARVLSALGNHPLCQIIKAELAEQGVQQIDLMPNHPSPPPLSSILVTQTSGDRAVASRNAVGRQAEAPQQPESCLDGVDIVLVDGHQIPVSVAIAQVAQAQAIPVVLDGGSWKPGLEALLPWVSYAICSANFYPPQCPDRAAVIHYLQSSAPQSHIAITDGPHPIHYQSPSGSGTIGVPPIQPVDTLGAGDAFHGAFCHWILRQSFVEALATASQTAALACSRFGTRHWLNQIPQS